VRDAALIRDGKGVQIDGECSITAGTWLDPYTGKTARRCIWIKSDWDLSVNPNEKTALSEMPATCKVG
jgi:hypothetical protein